MNPSIDEAEQTDQGINWHHNTASELGAMLYELFGPFSHISPQRKSPRCEPLTIKWGYNDPSSGQAVHCCYADRVFAVRWITGSIPMDARVVARGNWNDRLILGPSASSGFSAAPTWRDLTNGTGKWTLAETLLIPPNAAFSLDIRHPHDALPDLVPRPEMQVVLHGFSLDVGSGTLQRSALEPHKLDAPASRLAYLEELLDHAQSQIRAAKKP
jgi:hypothetical protein